MPDRCFRVKPSDHLGVPLRNPLGDVLQCICARCFGCVVRSL